MRIGIVACSKEGHFWPREFKKRCDGGVGVRFFYSDSRRHFATPASPAVRGARAPGRGGGGGGAAGTCSGARVAGWGREEREVGPARSVHATAQKRFSLLANKLLALRPLSLTMPGRSVLCAAVEPGVGERKRQPASDLLLPTQYPHACTVILRLQPTQRFCSVAS